MATVIQGAKSSEYIKTKIKGIEGTQDSLSYVTSPDIPGKRIGIDVVQHGKVMMAPSLFIEAGSAGRKIVSTAHGLKKGWMIQPKTGNSEGEEIMVLKVIDVDTFVIAAPFDIAIGDEFEVFRHITANYNSKGDLNVQVTAAGPTEFILDGVNQIVTEDTVDPLNNRPLPVKVMNDPAIMTILKEGVPTEVQKSVTPANTVAIPVEIVSASGTEVNISVAGNLVLDITDMGANFSSMRLGDGTGNYVGLDINGDLKVADATALAKITDVETAVNDVETAVNAVDTTLTTTIDTSIGQVSIDVLSLGPKIDALTTYMTADQEPNLSALVSGLATLNADVAKNAKLEEVRVLLGDEVSVTGMAGDFVDATLHERLSRISHRIHELDNKFNSLGQHNKSNSVSVVLANNSDPIDVVVPSVHFDTQYDATLSAIETVVSVPAGATSFTIYCNSASSEATLLSFVTFVGTMGLVIEQGRMEEFKAPASGSIYIKGQGGASIVCIIWNK